MRRAKACLQCRLAKRRCDQPDAGGACDQCLQRDAACSAAGDGSEQQQDRHTGPLTPVQIDDGRFNREARYLVDLYFVYIHDKAHTLFHGPSFKESVLDGTVSRPLLLSIMGLSARYAEDAEVRSRGELYASKAKKALKDNLEDISLEAIQTCIIVGNHCIANGNPSAQSLYYVLATRMAQILQIWTPDKRDDGVRRETKLRTWWSCFILDTWASGGSGLSPQFQPAIHSPRVPMDEADFHQMKPGDPDVPDQQWKPGIWGHTVRLVSIYSRIQKLHKDLAEATEWDEHSMEDRVASLHAELVAFEESLGPHLRYSRANLVRHVAQGLGRVFVSFHLGFHHYHTVLFYQYLDRRRPSTRNGEIYADRCKYNAKMVCDILRASREQEGAEALYNIVGHVTVVSSSVLLHTYLFGATDELPEARWRLESNLESLKQLRSYYPSIELMIQRLVIFQNSCLRSVTGAYRFDRWMIKFLIQHTSALEEKDDDLVGAEADIDFRAAIGADNVHFQRVQVTQGFLRDMQGM